MLSKIIEKKIEKARNKSKEYTKKYCPETYSAFQLFERVIEQFILEFNVLEKLNIELHNKHYKLDYESHNKILNLNIKLEQQEKLMQEMYDIFNQILEELEDENYHDIVRMCNQIIQQYEKIVNKV